MLLELGKWGEKEFTFRLIFVGLLVVLSLVVVLVVVFGLFWFVVGVGHLSSKWESCAKNKDLNLIQRGKLRLFGKSLKDKYITSLSIKGKQINRNQ
jgi:hypothetical protein